MSKKNDGIWYRRKNSMKVETDENTEEMRQLKTQVEKTIRISNAKLLGLRTRKTPLGNTGPKPQFDSYAQGGNAYPRKKRREHPSGYHSCG
jgi:hypothetical protein